MEISLESGEGRLGQFAQGLVEQIVLLRAEQKACPAGSSAQARHVLGSPEQGSLDPTLMSFLRNATPAAAAGPIGTGAGTGADSFVVLPSNLEDAGGSISMRQTWPTATPLLGSRKRTLFDSGTAIDGKVGDMDAPAVGILICLGLECVTFIEGSSRSMLGIAK